MKLVIESNSQNEAFARTVVAAYITRLNPTLEELADVKTAVSEAVTNSIIHGYNNLGYSNSHSDENRQGCQDNLCKSDGDGKIEICCDISGQDVYIEIIDYGVGIADIEKAMEPLYTTKPEWERSGMGFAFMEAFMDELEVYSEVGKGTRVKLCKHIGRNGD